MSDDEVWFDDFDDSLGGDLSQGSPCPTDSDEGADAPLPGEPPSSAQSKARLYTIIDRPSLHAIQREALDQVQGILGCDTTTARALLTHFSWDAESVLGTIAERGQDEVYKRCGLLSRAPEGAQPLPSRPGTRRTITCGVCMSDVPAAGAEAMACGHAFCRDCWRQHLRMGVQEGLSRRLRCMAPSCGVVCSEDKVRALLEPTMVDKYDQALLGERVHRAPELPVGFYFTFTPTQALLLAISLFAFNGKSPIIYTAVEASMPCIWQRLFAWYCVVLRRGIHAPCGRTISGSTLTRDGMAFNHAVQRATWTTTGA